MPRLPGPYDRAGMSERKRLLILGSTGSIGRQALDVCERSEEFELVGLSAESSWEPLLEQARAHGVKRIGLADQDAAARAGESWTDGQVLAGAEGLVRLVLESEPDLVLNSLVGSAGLAPTVATLGEGIDPKSFGEAVRNAWATVLLQAVLGGGTRSLGARLADLGDATVRQVARRARRYNSKIRILRGSWFQALPIGHRAGPRVVLRAAVQPEPQ